MCAAPVLILAGFGLLVAGWVAPMISDHVPRAFVVALLMAGLALIVGDVVLRVTRSF
jgi:hypothetical protein